jgi:hypothetical protein
MRHSLAHSCARFCQPTRRHLVKTLDRNLFCSCNNSPSPLDTAISGGASTDSEVPNIFHIFRRTSQCGIVFCEAAVRPKETVTIAAAFGVCDSTGVQINARARPRRTRYRLTGGAASDCKAYARRQRFCILYKHRSMTGSHRSPTARAASTNDTFDGVRDNRWIQLYVLGWARAFVSPRLRVGSRPNIGSQVDGSG